MSFLVRSRSDVSRRAALLAAAICFAVPALAAAAPTFHSTGNNLWFTDDGVESAGGLIVGPDGALWTTEPGGPEHGGPSHEGDSFARIGLDGTLAEFAPVGVTDSDRPGSLAAGSDGGIWFTLQGADGVGRFDPATHEATIFHTGITAGARPNQIVAGPDGNLWFTEIGRHAVGKLEPHGASMPPTITEYTTGVAGDTIGITSGPGGLWFTEITSGGGTIAKIDTAGVVGPSYSGVLAGESVTDAPIYIVEGPEGNLWYDDGGPRGYIGRLTPAGQITRFTTGFRPSSYESEPVVGADGNIWLVENDWDTLLEVTPAGVVTSYARGPGTFGELNGPLASAPDGDIWEISRFGEILKIDVGASGGSTPGGPETGGSPETGGGSPGGGPATGPSPAPGGGTATGTAGAVAPKPTASAKPKPKPLKCRKGTHKKVVKGKARCVRQAKAKKKHHR
jgi:streptogramin lyase